MKRERSTTSKRSRQNRLSYSLAAKRKEVADQARLSLQFIIDLLDDERVIDLLKDVQAKRKRQDRAGADAGRRVGDLCSASSFETFTRRTLLQEIVRMGRRLELQRLQTMLSAAEYWAWLDSEGTVLAMETNGA